MLSKGKAGANLRAHVHDDVADGTAVHRDGELERPRSPRLQVLRHERRAPCGVGHVRAELPAELIGEEWQSAGRFNGELTLAGTPATAVYSGRFRGEKLALRFSEQALHLANGELLIDLDENLLRVRKLGFDSLQQPVPRALRLSDRESISTLASRFHTTPDVIRQANNIPQKTALKAGSTILVPKLSTSASIDIPAEVERNATVAFEAERERSSKSAKSSKTSYKHAASSEKSSKHKKRHKNDD